jgi:hypothetical protein
VTISTPVPERAAVCGPGATRPIRPPYASVFARRGLVMMVATLLGVSLLEPGASAAPRQKHGVHDSSGQPGWTQDSFSLPITAGPYADSSGPGTHAETSTVYFNGQWLMYSRHRSYVDGNPERYTIALSMSRDGTNFTYRRDVVVPQPTVGCHSVTAPKLVALPANAGDDGEPAMLAMVYEADSSTPGPGCPSPLPVYQVGIALATSTDGYRWDHNRIVLVPKSAWEGNTVSSGREVGNVGTPYIEYAGGKIYIGYHGFSGLSTPPWLQRGVAVFDGSDPTNITAVDDDGNNNLIHPASPITFEDESGAPETDPAYSAGYGEADVTRWHGAPGGAHGSDAYYMVVEGWQGSPFCNRTDTWEVIAIAKASSPLGPFLLQGSPLLPSFQGGPASHGGSPSAPAVAPYTSCGRDLPSWQYHDGRYKVILTGNNKTGNQRIVPTLGGQQATG